MHYSFHLDNWSISLVKNIKFEYIGKKRYKIKGGNTKQI